MIRLFGRVAVGLCVLLAGDLFASTIIAAHSWYPDRCCHGKDCFKADKVKRFADGTLEISKGDIVVRITRTFPIEASPDGQPHFCVFHTGWSYEARCVFLPVGS
jgi:hypothetical protein